MGDSPPHFSPVSYTHLTILKDENEIVVLELENSLKTTVRIDDKHNIAGGKKKKFFFF